MEIIISEMEKTEGLKGFNVTYINVLKKKSINESDFFPNGSEIETTIQQLRKQLRKYFDANP